MSLSETRLVTVVSLKDRKYGKLSDEKMTQRLIAESEYLIGLYLYTDDQG